MVDPLNSTTITNIVRPWLQGAGENNDALTQDQPEDGRKLPFASAMGECCSFQLERFPAKARPGLDPGEDRFIRNADSRLEPDQ
jgi:hypothetical protein